MKLINFCFISRIKYKIKQAPKTMSYSELVRNNFKLFAKIN